MRFFAASLLLVTSSAAVVDINERQTVGLTGSTVCSQISSAIKGGVYTSALSTNWIDATYHWMSSSSQTPLCVVEAQDPQDVSAIMKIVGSTRTPFAIKSGGHASNQGFSSTTGVQISLVRQSQVTLSADKSTVEIGLGNTWSDVYKALDGTGVNVVGGRVSGPGTGGFALGGGYSWKTDQYGLTCDNIIQWNLVLPNGTITAVTAQSNPDLAFALKGGLNRFGIVTSIVMNTHPQVPQVYGGLQLFGPEATQAVLNATYDYQQKATDPKAQVITTLNGGIDSGSIVLYFYDGPTRPAAFDSFNNLTGLYTPLINTVQTQSFYSFSQSAPSEVEAGNRGAFASLSTTDLTLPFLNAVANESTYYGTLAIAHLGLLISYDTEPFKGYGQYATDSAYPHDKSQLPLNLYFSWQTSAVDSYWQNVMQQSINHLTDVAKAEGIYDPDVYVYPNYALSTYTGAQLYGPTNSARLRQIQAEYDPNGVMELTGGFTF